MLIFLFLLILFWGSFCFISFDIARKFKQTLNLREVFLLSAIILGVLVVLVTEGLSLFTLLTPTAVKITWAAIFLSALGWVGFFFLRRRENLGIMLAELRMGWNTFKSSGWSVHLLTILVLITFSALLLIIYKYPTPNNGDSLHYHLSRVLHWEQQASLRHFAIRRMTQISFPPFSEYTLLNFYFLTGCDHFLRITQWLGMLVYTVGVTDIVKTMGGNRKQQSAAALIGVSIPMAILQATSTQNDLTTASWLIVFLAFGLRFKRHPNHHLWAAATGMALGLALLTKSTAFIFAFPLSLWIGISVILRHGFRRYVWQAGAIILGFALVINLGHFTRNTITFGTPLGTPMKTTNEEISIPVLVSNGIRNIQMNIPANTSGITALDDLSDFLTKVSWKLHELTRLGPEDPRNTFNDYIGFEKPAGLSRNESVAGSFLHLLLIFITIVAITIRFKNNDKSQLMLVLILTYILFALILKSQTPVNRLLLPFGILWVPLIATSIFPCSKRWWVAFPVAVWVLSLPWLINNYNRPLVTYRTDAAATWPREGVEAYFVRSPELLPVFDEITDHIMDQSCTEVGLRVGPFLEYAFRMMLRDKGFEGIVEHVLIRNESQPYENLEFSPCVIVSSIEIYRIQEYPLELIGNYFVYTIEPAVPASILFDLRAGD